jgi:conjugative relaxase-like TrwC/TraI family protein
MLRIITSTSSHQAKKYYHEGLTREGYYSEGQELPGRWLGKAARRLGLKGQVGQEFNQLCDNLHPETGEKLTPRMKDNRRCGYDFNFHVPKSVTLAYNWTGDDRILRAFRQAVRETMEDIEREAATRVRSDGRDGDRITGNLVWSEFVHFTARPVDGIPDPHLHAHCYVFNTTFDPVENRWKAAQFGDIKRHGADFQAAFLSRMATSLTELGYAVELSGQSFELAGISRELIEKFSRRSKLVKDKAKELGIDSHAGKDGLAARTREKKIKDLLVTDLKPVWWSRLSPAEIKALDGLKAALTRAAVVDAVQRDGVSPARAVVDLAMKHVFERVSVITERNLVTEALQWSYGIADLKAIKQAVKDAPLIRVAKHGETFVTTWEVRAEEGRIVDRCKLGRDKFPALSPAWKIQDTALNAPQQAGVFHILGSHDFITGIEGKAGVGKSRLLHEVRKGIEQSGNKLLVLTPMAITAHDTMRKDGFEDAETVAKLLGNESLQAEAQGAVWLVDEAGLLSCHMMDELTCLAERLNARLVLVGDTKQHHAVERGQAFDLLQKFGELPVATVDEIQRQTGAYKRAVEQIAARDFKSAFTTLEEMGAFRELPKEEREEAVAADYLAIVKKGKSALVVSPTHAECENVTHAIRHALKERGEMTDGKTWNILRDLSLTAAQKCDARHYAPGQVVKINKPMKGFKMGREMEVVEAGEHGVWVQSEGRRKELPLHEPKHFSVFARDKIEISQGERIRITANGRDRGNHRLYNGSDYTVKKFARDGGLVLENGFRLDKNFPHLAWGYASTSHAAQGKTVDCVLVCQSGLISSGATDAKQFYVSVSRGRKEVRIYTDDVAELRENVTREREREMAMELIQDEGKEEKRKKNRAAQLKQEMEAEQETVRQQSSVKVQEAQEDEMSMSM